MKKILSLLAVIAASLALSSCGKYDFKEIYRYPCQDPANWESEDCKPPKCEAWGGCTKDVLKGTPLYEETTTDQSTQGQ